MLQISLELIWQDIKKPPKVTNCTEKLRFFMESSSAQSQKLMACIEHHLRMETTGKQEEVYLPYFFLCESHLISSHQKRSATQRLKDIATAIFKHQKRKLQQFGQLPGHFPQCAHNIAFMYHILSYAAHCTNNDKVYFHPSVSVKTLMLLTSEKITRQYRREKPNLKSTTQKFLHLVAGSTTKPALRGRKQSFLKIE